ncbi:hypothetical protein JTB14_022850 [Gonioctena quinquepunctata]|nr:hypothetical protein JTB14_022850 [Gonioctena quinquepunctata]
MEELLRKWELPQLIKNFQDNEVTTEILPKLTERIIKELIPNIGTRVRFTECFKKYFGETETSFYQTNNVENIDISVSDIIPEEKEVQSESSNSTTSISSRVLIPLENREISFHSHEQLDLYKIVFPEFNLEHY